MYNKINTSCKSGVHEMMINRRAKFHFDNWFNEVNNKIGPYVIYQVGDLCCEPGYQVWNHTQKVYEISFIVSGKGTFYVNGDQYEVSAGMLFLNKIGEKHEVKSSSLEPLRFFYIGFTFSDDIGNTQIMKLKSFFDNPENRIVYHVSGMSELFAKLFIELKTGDFFLKRCWKTISIKFSSALIDALVKINIIHTYSRKAKWTRNLCMTSSTLLKPRF